MTAWPALLGTPSVDFDPITFRTVAPTVDERVGPFEAVMSPTAGELRLTMNGGPTSNEGGQLAFAGWGTTYTADMAIDRNQNRIRVLGNAASRFEVDRTDNDPVWIMVGGTLEQVLVGASDSGGAGYRQLVVVN